MNRNQITFIVVPLLLIFGYQNCQKANFDPSQDQAYLKSEGLLPQDVQVIELKNENIESLQFKSNEVVQVPHGGGFYSLLKTLIYDFDINSGELFVIDEQTQSNVRYCLTDSLKNQVISLLYSSSICKNGVRVNQGVACTQALQEGYANLITARDQFRLGSASDGCGSNMTDLCEGSADLKTWFNSVKAQLASLQCQ